MQYWEMWHGGASYAAPYAEDAIPVDSVREAILRFESRYYGSDPVSGLKTPCVDNVPPDEGGPETWLIVRRPGEDKLIGGDIYPDRIIYFGPRGGIRVEST
jgi:hypothetical protein